MIPFDYLKDSDVRWLTSAQVECKLRMGLKGVVGSLYDNKKLHEDLSSPQTTYTTISSEFYIPEDRKLTLTSHQAMGILSAVQKKVPLGEAHQLVPQSKYYGPDVSVHAWGVVHKEQLYIFRFSTNSSGVCQIWCILEQKEDFSIEQDPVINYVLSLPYLPKSL